MNAITDGECAHITIIVRVHVSIGLHCQVPSFGTFMITHNLHMSIKIWIIYLKASSKDFVSM